MHKAMWIFAAKENNIYQDDALKLSLAWKLILDEFADEEKNHVIYKKEGAKQAIFNLVKIK